MPEIRKVAAAVFVHRPRVAVPCPVHIEKGSDTLYNGRKLATS